MSASTLAASTPRISPPLSSVITISATKLYIPAHRSGHPPGTAIRDFHSLSHYLLEPNKPAIHNFTRRSIQHG